jgi:hypothetical protein
MAQHELKTIGTTPVRLTPPGLHSGMDITIQNVNATGVVYIGGTEDLSSINYGYRLAADHAIAFELPSYDALYAIGETSNMKIAIIKTGLEVGA